MEYGRWTESNRIIRWSITSLQLHYHSNVPFQTNSLVLVLMIVLARLMSCLAGKEGKKRCTFQLTGFFNEQSRMSFSGCWTQKQYKSNHYEIFKVESAECLSSFISHVCNEKDNISYAELVWNRSAIIKTSLSTHNVDLTEGVEKSLMHFRWRYGSLSHQSTSWHQCAH